MTREETKRLPENLAKQVLARAAELDATDRGSLSIPDLRSVAVEAGISERALDQERSEVEAMEAAPAKRAQEQSSPRFKRRFIAAVAVIALLLAMVGSMMIIVPNSVPASDEPAIDIALPPVPPAPPPQPPGR